MKKIVVIFIVMAVIGIVKIGRADSLAGTYRCWHFNVGGQGGKCASPPIVLNADGTYMMSSEKGRYSVEGDQLVLSASEHRGPGKISGQQLQFEYDYKGQHQTVTYLRSGDAPQPQSKPASGGISQLELTISCSASGSAVDWINTCSLDCGDGNRYDALAVQKDRETLTCGYRQVPPNKTCSVTVSSGFDAKVIGSLQTAGSVNQTLRGQCAW